MVQQIINMRDYNITKHKGNTHYQVYVTDSYGREKGNFFTELQECYDFAYKVWEQEQPLTDKGVKQELLNSAILNCIQLEENNN